MTNNDSGFVGSIPDLYDRNVGPLMMVPYAGDIAGRLSDMATGRLLEVAAGTGIVTAALARWCIDRPQVVSRGYFLAPSGRSDGPCRWQG